MNAKISMFVISVEAIILLLLHDCTFKIYQAAQNTGYHLKKTWLFLKGFTYLQVIFMLFWIKQVLTCFKLQRNRTGNGLSNIKDTFAESLQLQTSVLHESMYILKAEHSSLNDGWVKYKKKYLMCQILIKLLKEHIIPNSCLQNLNILFIKSVQKN